MKYEKLVYHYIALPYTVKLFNQDVEQFKDTVDYPKPYTDRIKFIVEQIQSDYDKLGNHLSRLGVKVKYNGTYDKIVSYTWTYLSESKVIKLNPEELKKLVEVQMHNYMYGKWAKTNDMSDDPWYPDDWS